MNFAFFPPMNRILYTQLDPIFICAVLEHCIVLLFELPIIIVAVLSVELPPAIVMLLFQDALNEIEEKPPSA
jgi:hypothetical protein